jgi:hypothetical protein
MRHVYNNPPSKDKTPGQKRCRQFFEDDFKGFVALLMKLEEAHRAELATVATPDGMAAPAPGEQELRVEGLIERLLSEWEEEDKRFQEKR